MSDPTPIESTTRWCLMGWKTPATRPGCSYTGGCYCKRDEDHDGRHICICGSTRRQYDTDPKWTAKQEVESNEPVPSTGTEGTLRL